MKYERLLFNIFMVCWLILLCNSRITYSKEIGKNYRKIMVRAYAYTHTGNPTCTGIYPYKGIIATDPSVIPLHSKVYIPGYGYAVAEDTGGNIIGKTIDLFFNSEKECRAWGIRYVEITIYE